VSNTGVVDKDVDAQWVKRLSGLGDERGRTRRDAEISLYRNDLYRVFGGKLRSETSG
jgi:hypothetical protein